MARGWLRNVRLEAVKRDARAAEKPLFVRCSCGFEALIERAEATLVALPGGGWACPACGAEPPHLRVLPEAEWRRFDAAGRRLPEAAHA